MTVVPRTEWANVNGENQEMNGEVLIDDNFSVEPVPGSDIYTSIDVNIQDVAEEALLKQLQDQKGSRLRSTDGDFENEFC